MSRPWRGRRRERYIPEWERKKYTPDGVCITICDRAHPCNRKHEEEDCPKCLVEFDRELPCGHTIKAICGDVHYLTVEYFDHSGRFGSPEPEELKLATERLKSEGIVCPHPCKKVLQCGHKCQLKCIENCGDAKCQNSVRITRKCGHRYEISCIENDERDTYEYKKYGKEPDCLEIVPFTKPCGHPGQIECYRTTAKRIILTEEEEYCEEPCGLLKCGHPCDGNYSKCGQGRYHQPCKTPCGKTLICGHICEYPCPAYCPPCTKPCTYFCTHAECQETCMRPCTPCPFPCTINCPHSKCTKLCGEECDRELCLERCTYKNFCRLCRRRCLGFCGETCIPLCRKCDNDELVEATLMTRSKIRKTDRFVFLFDCSHTIEVEVLTKWIELEAETGEIKLRCCPICRTEIKSRIPLLKCFIDNKKQVDELKRRLVGTTEEMIENLKNLKEEVEKAILDFEIIKYPQIAAFFLELNDVQIHKETFAYIKEVESVWLKAETWSRIPLDDENVMAGMYAEDVKKLFDKMFTFFSARVFPLTPGEKEDLELELFRIQDTEHLFTRSLQDETSAQLAKLQNNVDLFQDAAVILFRNGRYTDTAKREFWTIFRTYELAIETKIKVSDEERTNIVAAFGSASGRWFKCPNGHVYVVTECGGVTEYGTCNECGTLIGGRDHQVVETNALASEMDGATEPLFRTSVLLNMRLLRPGVQYEDDGYQHVRELGPNLGFYWENGELFMI